MFWLFGVYYDKVINLPKCSQTISYRGIIAWVGK